MGLGRLAILSMVGTLVFPAGAGHAATLTLSSGMVIYEALPGETNNVVFTIEGPTSFRVADPGATITIVSPEACVPAGADVVCETFMTDLEILAVLHNGNDRADLSIASYAGAYGNEGDDVLVGSREGESIMVGGVGNDRLIGSPGSDRLSGYTGDDQIFCGRGSDSLCFGRSRARHGLRRPGQRRGPGRRGQ